MDMNRIYCETREETYGLFCCFCDFVSLKRAKCIFGKAIFQSMLNDYNFHKDNTCSKTNHTKRHLLKNSRMKYFAIFWMMFTCFIKIT